MKDYSKEIIENIDTYFLVVDKDGEVISHSDGAPAFLSFKDGIGKNIDEIGKLIPDFIWKKEIEGIEILWKGEQSEHYKHFILQSIPFKDGYILCFRESKPPRVLITDKPFIYQVYLLIGIPNGIRRKSAEAARDKKPILITGETGVGKEVLAKAIHHHSGRKGHFIPVNCTALPESLMESELFGYEPGTFTGADKGGRAGRFELADGGTIFLDEIGEMPYKLQGKLLRVIEDKEIWRMGAKEGKKVDFKLICATNQNIKKLVEKKAFRKDLYYRINFTHIHLSPLRERMEHFNKFVAYFIGKYGDGRIRITKDASTRLRLYNWPGNVRELENVIAKLVIKKEWKKDKKIRVKDLPKKIRNPENKSPRTLKEKIDKFKKEEIKKALEKHKGNKTKAAEELGISRWGLIKMIKSLSMEEKDG